MTGPPDRYLAEILGQPAAFGRAAAAVAAQRDVFAALAAGLAEGLARDGSRGPIVLTGMGSSYDACLAAAAVLGAAGVVVTTVETAELLHVRWPMLASVELLVLVSQSGRSAEAVRLAEDLGRRDRGGRPLLLAITNGAATPLAARADLAIDTGVGPEACPSTMTFAGSLVALSAVAAILAGAAVEAAVAGVGEGAAAASAAAAELLAEPDETGERLAAWLGGRPTIVALGRGAGLAAAEMAALTLMEAAGFAAAALPTAEFRHGPLEIVGPDVAVVLFALEPATEGLDRAFAGELAAAGAAVLLVGPPGPPPPGVEQIAVPGPRGSLAAGVALGPLQLLARHLARARGRQPGTFAHAAKVTTRE
jgi:glucosamine--fructose-6-phosphate aminotransferase (isomerizing)